MFTQLITTTLSMLPAWFAVFILAFLTFVVVATLIRLVGAVLDALPFI